MCLESKGKPGSGQWTLKSATHACPAGSPVNTPILGQEGRSDGQSLGFVFRPLSLVFPSACLHHPDAHPPGPSAVHLTKTIYCSICLSWGEGL